MCSERTCSVQQSNEYRCALSSSRSFCPFTAIQSVYPEAQQRDCENRKRRDLPFVHVLPYLDTIKINEIGLILSQIARLLRVEIRTYCTQYIGGSAKVVELPWS